MVIYSVMQSVEGFCSFLSNSSMLLEKSNNYSGTLLFHAAGIVDLWYPLQAVHFARHPYSDTTTPINTTVTITSIAMSQSKSARMSQQNSVFARSRHTAKAAFCASQHKKRLFIVLFQEQRALRKVIPADPLHSPGCARRSGRRRYPPENPAACPSASADRGRSGGWWSWAPWPDRRTGSRSPSPPEP